MNEHPMCPGATMVTLIDGRMVWSDAEEWRAECEARYVALLDDWHRADYLATVSAKRSPAAAQKLEADAAKFQQGAS